MQAEVLLYSPEYDENVTRSNRLELPLSILHVAGALERSGHPVAIIDGRRPGAHTQLASRTSPPLWFGVSCFLGQLDDALEACSLLRARFPETPIVWGGWLPTVHPDPFLAHPLVTAIVRGAGEHAVCAISDRLARGLPLDAVSGLTVRDVTRPDQTPGPPAATVPPSLSLPLHLLDSRSYELVDGRADLVTSRGCELRCTFCAMATVYHGGWFANPAREVVSALEDLQRLHGVRRVQFYDDSFFNDRQRVLEIAAGILDAGLELRWMATGTLVDLASLSGEEWDLLKQSGCSVVSCGIESGSDRVRRRLGKSFDNEAVLALARMLANRDIRFSPLFMLDSPEETDAELRETLGLARTLLELDPKSRPYFSAFFYYPVPGTPLFRTESRSGALDHYPGTLHDLRSGPPESRWAQAPWIPRNPVIADYRSRRRAQIRAFYFFAAFLSPTLQVSRSHALTDLYRQGLLWLLRWRMRHWCFRLPLEWQLYRLRWWIRRTLWSRTASDGWMRMKVGLLPQGDPEI